MHFIVGKPFSASAGDDISNANKRMADSEAYKVSKKSICFLKR